jgi:hypothetical protein
MDLKGTYRLAQRFKLSTLISGSKERPLFWTSILDAAFSPCWKDPKTMFCMMSIVVLVAENYFLWLLKLFKQHYHLTADQNMQC